jgi:hypothetical protein
LVVIGSGDDQVDPLYVNTLTPSIATHSRLGDVVQEMPSSPSFGPTLCAVHVRPFHISTSPVPAELPVATQKVELVHETLSVLRGSPTGSDHLEPLKVTATEGPTAAQNFRVGHEIDSRSSPGAIVVKGVQVPFVGLNVPPCEAVTQPQNVELTQETEDSEPPSTATGAAHFVPLRVVT